MLQLSQTKQNIKKKTAARSVWLQPPTCVLPGVVTLWSTRQERAHSVSLLTSISVSPHGTDLLFHHTKQQWYSIPPTQHPLVVVSLRISSQPGIGWVWNCVSVWCVEKKKERKVVQGMDNDGRTRKRHVCMGRSAREDVRWCARVCVLTPYAMHRLNFCSSSSVV